MKKVTFLVISKQNSNTDHRATLKLQKGIRNLRIFTTPYNVGSVHWRLFSTLEVVQYIGGCSVHWGDNISTVGDSFSTVGR